jgi:hypothetical protein
MSAIVQVGVSFSKRPLVDLFPIYAGRSRIAEEVLAHERMCEMLIRNMDRAPSRQP